MKLMSIDRYILLNWINIFGCMCKIGRWLEREKVFCNDKTMKLIRAVHVIGRVSLKGFACIIGMYEDI